MAVAFDRKLGESNSGTGSNAGTIATGGLSAGEFVVLWVACDNVTATSPSILIVTYGGVTQTGAIRAEHNAASASAGAATKGFIYVIPSVNVTGASGSDLVGTWGGGASPDKSVMIAAVFTGASDTLRGTAQSSTSSPSTLNVATAAAGDLLLGLVSDENNAAQSVDADYTQPGGDGQVFTSGGGGAANVTMGAGYRIATGDGAPDHFTSSWSRDGGHCLVCLQPGTSGQNISPSGIASAGAFGTAVVGRGPVSISPSGIASAEAFGSATVTNPPPAQNLTATGIASSEAHGSATITTGAVTVSPSAVGSAEAFGSATLTTGAVNITASGIASLEAFGTATLTSTVDVAPSAIGSAEAHGSPTLTTGPVDLAPTGVGSAEAFGTATVSAGGSFITPDGIASGEALGGPTITTGAVTLAPSGVASTEAFGSATVTTGAVTLAPSGVASQEALGAATVSPGPVDLAPSGIASGEALGAPTVTQDGAGSQNLSPTGLASAEAFGTAALTTGPVSVTPTGITSGEAFGTLTVTPGEVTLAPSGIATAEAFGTAAVEHVLGPAAITSAEAFGTATLAQGAGLQGITVELGITMPTDYMGTPTVTADQAISCTGIESPAAVSRPAVTRQVFILIQPWAEEGRDPRIRQGIPQGLSVWRKDGTWSYGHHSLRIEREADVFYHGGYQHVIDDEDRRVELELAGFSFETKVV